VIVIFLHGGPGGATSPANTKYFNPTIYRIILFDQRGAGRSVPACELRDNTTAHLIADIESLRTHLGISKWHLVFGGSWGATLALVYAQQHPDRVGAMVLRGIFTARRSEIEWARGPDGGAARIYPEAYRRFVDFLPDSVPEKERREDPAKAYYRYILSTSREPGDVRMRLEAAREWNRWELTIGALRCDVSTFGKLEDDAWVLAHATLEAHYEANGAWLGEGQILRDVDAIRNIPGIYLPYSY
jgi:proline iminopeptidase